MTAPGSLLLDPPATSRPSGGSGARGGGGGEDGGRGRGDRGDGSDLPLSSGRLLMVLVLVASTMLFTGLVGAVIVLRASADAWPMPGTPALPEGLGLNTVVLLASSAALAMAHVAQRRGRLAPTRVGLLAATGGAVAFLLLQVRCWNDLLLAGVVPATDNYAGNFYLLTAAHLAHALVGLGFLGWASVRAFRGYLIDRLALPIDLAAMFWHFVDLAWLAIYVLFRW